MAVEHQTKAGSVTGPAEALEALARVEAQVDWLIANWDRIGIESCLDRLAGARRGLATVGAALVREEFVDACSRRGDEAAVLRTIELLYGLPGSPNPGPQQGLRPPLQLG